MKRYITLTILGILILIVATFGLTYAFMRPKEKSENETDIDIKACAKIVFEETDGTTINLENTYPMDEEKGLETKPYEFDISSTCEEYVGFNLYLTSLATSEITDDAIHFAVTNENGKVLASDVLTNTTDGLADFDEEELSQLEKGIKGEKRSIHKVFSNNISKNIKSHYKLYLWVDKKVETSETMNKTFTVGVSVKSYAREETGAEEVIATANKDETTLYFHNAKLTGGAQDNSYRYSGGDNVEFNSIKNFVCLDGGETTDGKCANGDSDLYRIIGFFLNDYGQYEMKLIKYDYANIEQLGTIGAFKNIYNNYVLYYKGNENNLDNIGGYSWAGNSNIINEWSNSELMKTNLNEYYLNTYLKSQKNINIDKLITVHTWRLNGYDNHESNAIIPKTMYDNEMDKAVDSSPSYPTATKEVQNKIGLMYASDYSYAASPDNTSNWSVALNNYNNTTIVENNWMYLGLNEWTISRSSANTYHAYYAHMNGNVFSITITGTSNAAIRPVFYISSIINVISGDGSKEHPYRLSL